jgi:hypothetical protein
MAAQNASRQTLRHGPGPQSVRGRFRIGRQTDRNYTLRPSPCGVVGGYSRRSPGPEPLYEDVRKTTPSTPLVPSAEVSVVPS